MNGERAQTAATPAAASTGRPAWQTVIRRLLPPLFTIAIVVGVFWFFLPQFTSISAVWDSIQSMTWLQILTLLALAVWNLTTYFIVNVTTMPGLTFPQAAVATESSTAVSNTVPGGGALGIAINYAMFSSWGFSKSRTTVSLLVSGVFNNFAKLALPVFALALLALQGSPSGGRLAAGLFGLLALAAAIAVFAMLLSSQEAAAKVGRVAGRVASAVVRIFRRPPVQGWDKATVKFRHRTIALLRARWLSITLATLISHLSLYLVLLVSLRFVGVSDAQVGWIEVLAAFAFARLLTALPFTPGGLGVIELALITSMSAAGGDRADVAAGVLVFRALTYVLPIPLGALTYLFWRRNKSWRRPPGGAPRTDLVAEWVEPDTVPVPAGPPGEPAVPARPPAGPAAPAGG